ncbi:iron chelate uptake ABC transporter family permease subunit [Micromonospora sp. NPDC004704]
MALTPGRNRPDSDPEPPGPPGPCCHRAVWRKGRSNSRYLIRTKGVPVNRSRLILLLCGVTLAAAAITAAGPIGFLALAAPQLARRLTRAPSMPLIPSAMMGALLLLGADPLAQRALAPFQIPVGLVTGALDGGYLMWLLTRTSTRRP